MKWGKLGFFDAEIAHCVLPDVERLTNEIRPDSQTNLRGCTIPLSMTLFAIIDLFGYLMRDDTKRPKKGDALGSYRYLMSSKADLFPDDYGDSYRKIVKLFRNGLMHQLFPKATGIAKAGLEAPLIFDDASGRLILNVDVLSGDVVAALGKIRRRIQQGDIELAERIHRRLDILAADDYRELAKGDAPASNRRTSAKCSAD